MKGFRYGILAGTGLGNVSSGVGAHSYWRVNFTTNNGDGSFSTSGKLYMFTGFDRVPVSTGGTPVGSDAGQFGNVLANSFDYADSNWDSIWIGPGTSGYIGYHFAAPIEIVGIMLRARHTGISQMLKDFTVDYSDNGSTWSTAWTDGPVTFTEAHEGYFSWNPTYTPSYSGSPITAARYWRAACYIHTADTFSCAELEMAATAAGSDLTGSGTAISHNDGFGADDNAFDNNNSTFWAPNNTLFEWIGYDFGSGQDKALAEMRWKSRSSGVPGQNVKRGEVMFSYNGTLWHPGWIIYDGVAWTDGMQKTFADPHYV